MSMTRSSVEKIQPFSDGFQSIGVRTNKRLFIFRGNRFLQLKHHIGFLQTMQTLQIRTMLLSLFTTTNRSFPKTLDTQNMTMKFFMDFIPGISLNQSITNPFRKLMGVKGRPTGQLPFALDMGSTLLAGTGEVHPTGQKLVSSHQFPTLLNKTTIIIPQIHLTTTNNGKERLVFGDQPLNDG